MLVNKIMATSLLEKLFLNILPNQVGEWHNLKDSFVWVVQGFQNELLSWF